ncbi:MAG: MerR family transcriptional regulator [Rikenellaceae bacterium]
MKKLYYTMGEVSEMFDVNCSLIRYWEKHFSSVIKPVRNKKGNRLFTEKDIENFKLIYHLVKERGMTLDGAKKSLNGGAIALSREAELMDRLQTMRALLLEVREALKEDSETTLEEPQTPNSSIDLESIAGSTDVNADRPVRKVQAGEEKDKELFAFYEQNLF